MLMQRLNKNPKNNKKVVIWLVAASIVLVGSFCFWFFIINKGFSSGVEKNDPAQQAADTKDKQEFINNSKNEPSTEGPLNTGNVDESKVVVTAAQSAEAIVVSTKLYDYSDGTCSLNVINGSKQNAQSAPIIFQPEYSTCAGFSVDRDELGAGTWTIELTATSKGQSVTKKISLDVK